jgi:hypothetical protein
VNEEAEANSNGDSEKSSDGSAGPAAPSWGKKVLRVFLFTFLGTFLTGLTFADDIPTGLRVDFDLQGALKLGLIAALIAALIRLLVAMLPVFADDNVGRKRKS